MIRRITILEAFRLLTVTLLSLIVPLSFIVISRLSYAHHLIATSSSHLPPSSLFFSFVLYTNPALLYALVSSITMATLVHGLTSKVFSSLDKPKASTCLNLPIQLSWIGLGVFQLSVALGVEGTIQAGIQGTRVDGGRSFQSKLVFLLGLHEIMLLWFRAVVKPVVDDTVHGDRFREERWFERVASAVSLGTLWWLKLRGEVESMVGLAEARSGGGEVAGFLGWWLYYITVTIGMVRVVKGVLWFGLILHFQRERRNSNGSGNEPAEDEDDDDAV